MAVRATDIYFNYDRFRKCVSLFDSDRPGERDAAVRQALQLCSQGGLLFWEAVVNAFGDDGDAEAALKELQARLDQRENEAAILAEKYMEAEARIRQLMQGHDRTEQSHYFGELVTRAWSCPQTRLLLLSLVIAARFAVYCCWLDDRSLPLFWVLNLFTAGLGITLFCKWSSLAFAESDPLQLLVKSGLFGGGTTLSFDCLFGDWPWTYGFAISQWSGHPLLAPGWALLLFTAAAVVTVSKFSNCLI